MTATETRPGRRDKPLTVDEIVEAALAIARERGIDGVTMRTLAQRLGVTAMALYYYVKSKEELLELVANAVYERVRIPGPDEGAWDERIVLLLTRARRELLSYPGLGSFVLHFHSVAQGRKITEKIREYLLEGGFDAEEAERARATLHTFMLGRLMIDTERPGRRQRGPGSAASTSRRRSRRARDQWLQGSADELFEQGLRDILTGFLVRLGKAPHLTP